MIRWRLVRKDVVSALLFGVVASTAFMGWMYGGCEFRAYVINSN